MDMSKTLSLKCDWCGKKYAAERKSSKFCSQNCRIASHRYDPVTIANNHKVDLTWNVNQLKNIVDKNPEMIVEIDEFLRSFSGWISDQLRGDWEKRLIDEENKRLL